MFSTLEKNMIASFVEKIILELDHPEMPKENIEFELVVRGKQPWSYARIHPNWIRAGTPNPWNENARELLKPEE